MPICQLEEARVANGRVARARTAMSLSPQIVAAAGRTHKVHLLSAARAPDAMA